MGIDNISDNERFAGGTLVLPIEGAELEPVGPAGFNGGGIFTDITDEPPRMPELFDFDGGSLFAGTSSSSEKSSNALSINCAILPSVAAGLIPPLLKLLTGAWPCVGALSPWFEISGSH